MRDPAIITKEGRKTLATFADCPGCQTEADPEERPTRSDRAGGPPGRVSSRFASKPLARAGRGGGPVGSEGASEAVQDSRVAGDPADLAPQVEAVPRQILAPEEKLLVIGDHQLRMQVPLTTGLSAGPDHRIRLLEAAASLLQEDLDHHASRGGVANGRDHAAARLRIELLHLDREHRRRGAEE